MQILKLMYFSASIPKYNLNLILSAFGPRRQ